MQANNLSYAVLTISFNNARRSLGLGRLEFHLELHDSTINNRSAEGTWPHIRARTPPAFSCLASGSGMGSVLRDLVEMRKHNRSHDPLAATFAPHCGDQQPAPHGLSQSSQRNDNRKAERY
jgi:hypothetical protein